MAKRVSIIAILIVVLTIAFAKAQTFNVQSIDGVTQAIHVSTLEETGILTISCLTDTLHINGFIAIKGKISILNKTFLKIDYNIMGGTGLHVEHSLMLCVHNKHLIEALHLTSLFQEEFIDFSKNYDDQNMVDVKSTYVLYYFDLAGSDSQNYKLTIKIYNQRWSKSHPRENHNHHSQVTLNFDAVRNIFYSANQQLSKYFKVYDPKTRKEAKRYLRGTFPVVKLGTHSYYYIKNGWYEKGDGNYLSEYTYR